LIEPIESADGWDITIWVGESYTKANEIFDAVAEFIQKNFDGHDEEGYCTLDWGLGMSPAKFDD